MSQSGSDENSIFNVFFCSPKWEAALEEVPSFLEWVCRFFGVGDFTVAARLGGLKRSTPLHGSYTRLKGKIWQRELVHLVMDDQTRGFRAAFSFENRHPQVLPIYVSYLFPGTDIQGYDSDDKLKVLSLSVQEDAFQDAVRVRGEAVLRERLEELFVALGCVYGHGWHAPGPLSTATSSTSLISQRGSPQRKVRVIDYDFSHFIHDVFSYNYLSRMHLTGLPDPERLCGTLSGAQCKILYDAASPRGIALYVSEDGENRGSIERVLSPVIRRLRDPVIGPVYLVLRRDQIGVAGGPEVLDQFEFVKGKQVLPYGFVKVLCRTYQDPGYSDSDDDQQHLYEKMYPKLMGHRRWFEDMVSYPALRDGLKGGVSYSGVQRLPNPGRFDDSDGYYVYAKLFYGNSVDLRSLDVWFLLADAPDRDGVAILTLMIERWLSHVAEYPDAYGHLDVVAGLSFLAIGAKMCAHIQADARAIKEEALDLLMVMIDEINLEACRVQFVVLGEPGLGLGCTPW